MRKIRKAAKRVLSIVLAITMAFFGLPGWVSPERTAHADGEVTYEKGATMQDAAALTGEFGVIAFTSLQMFGHQHTNVMTARYIGAWDHDIGNTSECTIRTYLRETPDTSLDNYIQVIQYSGREQYGMKFGYDQDRLIVGSGHTVAQLNANQSTVDGVTVVSSRTVVAESDTWKYIDLAQLQRSYGQYSTYLAGKSATGNVTADFHDMNALTINVDKTDSGLAVLNLKASDIEQFREHEVTITFPSGSAAGLLINIDMEGRDSTTIKKTLLSIDGGNTTYGNAHPQYEAANISYENAYNDPNDLNRVYYNFYDSTKSDGQFRGTIYTDGVIFGTLIAPMANLDVRSGNYNGMIVVNTAKIHSETHMINPRNLPAAPKYDLTITANSDSKEYDGTELTNNGYTSQGLQHGHSIASFTFDGSQTNAGSSANVASDAKIVDAYGADVTADYNITYVDGSLTVLKKKITITAGSDAKEYDGTALEKDSYTHDGLVTGDFIESVTVTGSQTVAGASDNVPSGAIIKNSSNEDVTANYDIEYENGTLEVTPKSLTITADSDSKEYDGDALTKDSYTNTELADGDHIESVTVTGSQTEIGASDNVPSNAVVKNANGENVTNCYNITYQKGTLTVTGKYSLIITADSDEKVYDGTPLEKDTYKVEGLMDGDRVESVDVTGSQTFVGTSNNVPHDAVIFRTGVGDVTYCYEITYVPGTLEVTQRPLTITADSAERYYNGEPLTQNSYTNTDLAVGDTIESVSVSGAITDPGTEENVPHDAKIFNGDKDVTFCYDITYVNGELKVLAQKEITITATDADKVYDGTELKSIAYSVSDGLDEGDTIESVEFTGSQTKVGTSDNIPSNAKIVNQAGEDVTYKYSIEYKEGDLTVKLRPITITAEDAEKVYDGTELTQSDYTYDGNELAEGDSIENVEVSGSRTVVGTSPSTPSDAMIRNAAGEDVTACYDITYANGELKVTKKPLTITADSAERYYNGEPLTKDSYTHTDLVDGDTIESVSVSGAITDPGTEENVPHDAKIFNGDKDVTFCYDIEYVNGELKILAQNEIIITAENADKEYDGTELTSDTYTLTGSLDEGDTIVSVDFDGSQTKAGTSENTPSNAKIVNAKGEDVTYKYSIEYEAGELTVTPKSITITAGSDTKVYDGTPLTKDSYTNTSLAENDSIERVTVNGSQTIAGESDNVPSEAKIVNADGEDVTSSYDIKYKNGALEVTPKPITITADSAEKVYDGTALTKDTCSSGDLATGDTIESATVTGSQTFAGTSDNVPSEAKIVNADGEVVSGCYTITY
ncbi:MAG: hypothetical protein J6Y20_10855, partial [Lachnospiraceae bacterium]|nr:hypothetical protein [Lachnospiraceae bacterium]